jgi:hypothetical protein
MRPPMIPSFYSDNALNQPIGPAQNTQNPQSATFESVVELEQCDGQLASTPVRQFFNRQDGYQFERPVSSLSSRHPNDQPVSRPPSGMSVGVPSAGGIGQVLSDRPPSAMSIGGNTAGPELFLRPAVPGNNIRNI